MHYLHTTETSPWRNNRFASNFTIILCSRSLPNRINFYGEYDKGGEHCSRMKALGDSGCFTGRRSGPEPWSYLFYSKLKVNWHPSQFQHFFRKREGAKAI